MNNITWYDTGSSTCRPFECVYIARGRDEDGKEYTGRAFWLGEDLVTIEDIEEND